MKQQFLEAGQIVRTHGVRGELVLEPWADSPEFLAGVKHLYFDRGETDAGVMASRVHKGRLLITLRGVTTVEQGDALRGKVLYLDRDDVKLEEGQVFLQDLIGLKAVDGTTGKEYGELREVLPTGEDSFTFGILGGALFILVIAGIYTLSRNRLNIFKIYPALLIAIMVGFSLFLSSTFAYFPAFIVGIGVQSLFEVLLIMYFGILTTKGYATPALTFAMAGGFVRLGLAAGNSLALWYESMAVPVTQALTPPTCLAFMCLLAVVLVPLVRMEFSIVALTAAPPTRNEVEEICAEAAAEFGLSAREAEILLLIARGHTTNSMAEKLVISPYTVNTHIRHIYDKMQIHKRSELLNYLNMQRSDF